MSDKLSDINRTLLRRFAKEMIEMGVGHVKTVRLMDELKVLLMEYAKTVREHKITLD